jgi:hypothetical protein
VWKHMTEENSRRAVEVAERYADGLVSPAELKDAWYKASYQWREKKTPEDYAWRAAAWTCWDGGRHSYHVFSNEGWPIPPAEQASLLRDIVGNPFRPVTLPVCGRCGGDGKRHGSDRPFEWTPEVGYPGDCLVCGGVGWNAPYRTTQVLSLASDAYQHRSGRKCEACMGKKGSWFCPSCRGTGTIDDGSLDPITLGWLADALEEAGCTLPREAKRIVVYRSHGGHSFEVVARPSQLDEDEVIHTAPRLKDAIRWAEDNCAVNGGWHRFAPASVDIMPRQMFASLVADGYLPSKPHPILAHLRSPGSHVRGCWSLDLILGKE